MKQGTITCKCDTRPTGLGAALVGNSAQVFMAETIDPVAQWRITPAFDSNGMPLNGVGIQHVVTGTWLTGHPDWSLSGEYHPDGALDAWSTWDITRNDQQYLPFRPIADTNRNISATNCTQLHACLSTWEGGQDYEMWSFTPTPGVNNILVNVQLTAQCGGVLKALDGGKVTAVPPVQVQAANDPTVWMVEVGIDSYGTPQRLLGCMALFNQKTGTALAYQNGSEPCTLVSADKIDWRSVWTFESVNGYVAAHPAFDGGQNLNIFGGCSPNNPVVGTWPKQQNGSFGDNELWRFSFVK